MAVSTANVVGMLPGGQSGAILVGAHHDSRNATCPGASDGASGVAVVLEAARILARRSHRQTLVFASFGGEETFGLPGSREFVRRWDGPPIRLAITLDFVGTGQVFVSPFPTSPELWANRLLRQAEWGARTGRVSFDPWLAIVPRLVPFGFAADHEPFLEKHIPALNLSCQFPGWTYHTSEDQTGRVEGETLLATRDLVVRMVEEADARGPSTMETGGSYLPLPFFGYPIFLSGPLLVLAAAAVGFLGLATLVRFRRELASLSGIVEGLRGVLVCIPLAALAVSGPFLAEGAIRGISRVRHPWYATPVFHVTGAILALAFTLWLSLYLARFLRPSTLSGAYLVPAVVLEGATAAACLASGRAESRISLRGGNRGNAPGRVEPVRYPALRPGAPGRRAPSSIPLSHHLPDVPGALRSGGAPVCAGTGGSGPVFPLVPLPPASRLHARGALRAARRSLFPTCLGSDAASPGRGRGLGQCFAPIL